MLAYKPHIVDVYPVTRLSPGGNEVEGHGHGSSATTVPCQVSPISASKAFEDWGVETTEPYALHCDLGFDGVFGLGAKVVWDGRNYRVVSPALRKNAYLATDHLRVLLEPMK